MRRLGQCDEAAQKAANRFGTVPANHVRRDLIADQVGEHRAMAAARARALDHRLPDRRLDRRTIEEGYVLRPGQSDEEVQSGPLGRVEEPPRRHVEDAHRVDPGFGHRAKSASTASRSGNGAPWLPHRNGP